MTSTNICPNCGYGNQEDARFCGQCSEGLSPHQASRPILWFFGGAIGAIFLAIIVLFLIRPAFLFETPPQTEVQEIATATPMSEPRTEETSAEPTISKPVIVEEAVVAGVPEEAEQIEASIPEIAPAEEAVQVPVASSTPFPPTSTMIPTPTPTMTETPPPTSAVGTPSGQNERISSVDGMLQVYVEEGSFLMGANPINVDTNSDERSQSEVFLDGFWIDKNEVTNAQFALFLNNNGGHLGTCFGNDCMKTREQHELSHISLANNGYTVESGYEDHPVIMVTWYGASAYCQWAGRRLPTEAEWEKAARGDDGRRFPWGDNFEGGEANFCDLSCEAGHRDSNYDDGFANTAPVGRFPSGVSPYGALDMAGNVTEYVVDWYSDNNNAEIPSSNPQGPVTGTLKVRRGSAWLSTLIELETAFRSQSTPNSLNNNVGFRCAQSE